MLSALTSYAKAWFPPTSLWAEESPPHPAVLGLPNEVLMRIFSNLSNRKDVAACRLVCRDFKELSSPYLITRVILANRMETLSKFLDIVEHPYFRKHITGLVYDASWYDGQLAEDPISYAEARASEARGERGSDIKRRQVQYQQLWNRIQRNGPRADVPEDLLEDMDDRSQDSYYMVTYHDYNLRYGYQFRMAETSMMTYIIQYAFDKFPRLRHIVLGDYRNAAKEGESYSQCCDRLFGDTLEPYGLGVDPGRLPNEPTEEPIHGWDGLIELINSMYILTLEEPSRVCTFSIGGHRYAATPGSETIFPAGDIHNDPAIPLDLGDNPEVHVNPKIFKVFDGIQRLVLPVEPVTPPEVPDREEVRFGQSFVRPMIQNAAQTLVYCELGAVGWPFENPGCKTNEVLQKLLFDIDFPALRHLDLRGWKLNDNDAIKAFFSKVSTTLKELRLIHNTLPGAMDLARWAGENLRLDGVQIANYPLTPTMGLYDGRVDRDAETQESLWLAGRQNFLSKVAADDIAEPSVAERIEVLD